MIKKIATLYMALAIAAFAAGQPADPYGQLPQHDFNHSGGVVDTVTAEVESALPANRAAVEAKLIKAAQTHGATFACKSFVADMLRIVGSKASLPLACEWMNDPKTADLAVLALQGLQGSEVNAALESAMRQAKGKVKSGLIHTLAIRRDEAILSDLAQLAQGGDDVMARTALESLGLMGTPKAAETLQQLKLAPKRTAARANAQMVCARSLFKDGKADEAKKIWTRLYKSNPRASVVGAAMLGLVDCDGQAALPLLLKSMTDKREEVAVRAAAAARAMQGAEATKQLCDALPTLQPAVQVALLRTLRERGDKAAFAAVQDAMKSADESVKCEAIYACEKLGDAAVVESLIALAAGGDDAGKAAKDVLGKINQPGVDEKLMAQLESEKADEVAATAALLVSRGYKAATPKLMALAAAQDKAIRKAAFNSLQSFAGSSEVPALMAMLSKASEGDRGAIIQVIWAANKGIPKENRFQAVWNAAPADDKAARIALLSLASQSGGPKALESVKEYLQNSDPKAQDVAYRALFAWPDDSAAPATLDVLKTTDKLNYKVLAARSLSQRLSDKKAKLPLAKRKEMLNEALAKLERPEDKQQIQWAIDKLSETGKK